MGEDGEMLRVYLNREEQYVMAPQMRGDIPENLKQAVLAFEDRYFYQHPGFNPVALLRAAFLNIKHNRRISGGSTITMQLARMIRQKPRTYWNKFVEILLALKLEVHFSKEEILKNYLDHAPYGSNVQGYMAASHRFFGKSPERLTWAEASLLAVLPNAPGVIFPSSHQAILKKKRDVLLLKLKDLECITSEEYELSLLEEIPDRMVAFPLLAPHLADRIHQENSLDVVHTTVNAEIQSEVSFFVRQHAAKMEKLGIRNASVLVVNNVTGSVVSYVGSQNYHDLNRAGRVDGVMSPRSSGSILKPFLYALAIDEGLILPSTLIKDVPTYFNSFSPSNASEKFSGVVPAREALVYSLNIPAVRLLNKYGVHKFYHQMKEAGITTLFRMPDEYGLPIILGGAEVTPWDIARMYRGMARGGMFEEIHYLKTSQPGYSQQLVSRGASYLILDELKELIRPGLEFYWKKYSSQRTIAWKTGTSYGHKDAWAVGSTPEWTVVVWVGNFDGESNKGIAGMKSAGPLLFNIFEVLPEEEHSWFDLDGADFVEVNSCKHSGFYASRSCPDVETVYAPKDMKPLGVCPYHKKIYIEGNYHVCSKCWHGDQKVSYQLAFTPDVNYYLRQSGNLVSQVPAHHPDCRVGKNKEALRIIYPIQNANVFIPKDFGGTYQKLVAKVASQFPDRELFWYLDDELLGTSSKKPTFPLLLTSGRHQLTVVDAEGNKDQSWFNVIAN